jgi:hypothetical protein
MKKLSSFLLVLLLSLSAGLQAQTRYVAEDNQDANLGADNRFSIMLSDVLVRRLSLEYEHILDGGKMSLNIPFSVTVSPFEDPWSSEVHWWAGMGIKFYPTGQGVLRYFLGAEFRVISVTENYSNWYYDVNYDGHETITSNDYVNTAFLINNGLIYSPTNDFFVSLNMGVGFLSRNPDSQLDNLVPFATPSFRIGFKF